MDIDPFKLLAAIGALFAIGDKIYTYITMVQTKSGGNSTVTPEFIITRVIFHPSWIES
jgi:hypothetical protein